MFKRVYVERNIFYTPQVQQILYRTHPSPVRVIDSIDDVFECVRKPYLLKRNDRQLFLGIKKGKKLRLSPEFYGQSQDPHYLLLHTYNCIYECVYCYLQGYFKSPDIVFYINYQDFLSEIEKVVGEDSSSESIWFHTGEYSDSLALSHISGDLPLFFDLFKNLSSARLELRTKSVNLKSLIDIEPLPNVITSFTLSPQPWIDLFEFKTPSLRSRISALSKLSCIGHSVAVHLDPIIYQENFKTAYLTLLKELLNEVPADRLEYISLGVIRFTKQVFLQIKRHYPDSTLLAAEFVNNKDGKIRYNRPTRMALLKTVKALCIDLGIPENKIYICMEGDYSVRR